MAVLLPASLSTQFIGSLQKKYSIGSMDLLGQTAPIQAASLLVLGPFIDYFLQNASILEYHFSFMATVSSPPLPGGARKEGESFPCGPASEVPPSQRSKGSARRGRQLRF